MEILEAYDLTGSYRAAAELAGCDHHTVARYVALRDEGRPVERMRPSGLPTRSLPRSRSGWSALGPDRRGRGPRQAGRDGL